MNTMQPPNTQADPKKTHVARKRFGQNFLNDEQVIARIIKAISPQENNRVIEIGPGLGAITRHLLTASPSLTAVELDRDLAERLREAYPTLNLIEADALKTDFSVLLSTSHSFAEDTHPKKNAKTKIVGNLPYNISTPLLFHLLQFEKYIDEMYFMLQSEVVDRLTAEPGNKTYGRLSVMMQYHCEVEALFSIPPHAFTPAPKVHSAFVLLKPRQHKMAVDDFQLFSKMVNLIFQQRRKTLRNGLKSLISDWDKTLFPEALTQTLSLRAETLSVQELVNLSNQLSVLSSDFSRSTP